MQTADRHGDRYLPLWALVVVACSAPPIAVEQPAPPLAEPVRPREDAFLQPPLQPLRWLLGSWATAPGIIPVLVSGIDF